MVHGVFKCAIRCLACKRHWKQTYEQNSTRTINLRRRKKKWRADGVTEDMHIFYFIILFCIKWLWSIFKLIVFILFCWRLMCTEAKWWKWRGKLQKSEKCKKKIRKLPSCRDHCWEDIEIHMSSKYKRIMSSAEKVEVREEKKKRKTKRIWAKTDKICPKQTWKEIIFFKKFYYAWWRGQFVFIRCDAALSLHIDALDGEMTIYIHTFFHLFCVGIRTECATPHDES